MNPIVMKMRHTFYTLLPALFSVLMSSCYFDIDGDGIGPAINGSGNVVVEERILPEFDRILVEGSMDIILAQDNAQYLEVEADDNIVPIISTSVRGGELRIKSTHSYRSRRDVKVYITLNELEGLEIRGSSDVYGESVLAGDDLDLEIDGSGSMDLELYFDQLYAEINGSGNFRLSGEAIEQEIRINGSGDYRAADLQTVEADVTISGSGNSTVNVSDFLYAEIRGSGDVFYYGNPQVSSSIRGSGNLIRK
jgi:hypothetical protein